ncbi:hypothetical protein [Natronococcus sp. A-GB7]|nr:hypothetical protein [Natronococcus sp. A-GB7]MDG5821691.1 hypothetical protein [Natronococcus sp. A-GB7]
MSSGQWLPLGVIVRSERAPLERRPKRVGVGAPTRRRDHCPRARHSR